MDNIKPTLVLAIICIVATLLLVYAYELTKDRVAEQKALKFTQSAEVLFGDAELNVLDGENFGSEELLTVAVTDDGKTAMQLQVDGYETDGINVLIGIDENGAVCGIEFVSLADTPGLGSKIRDQADFREKFYGKTQPGDEVDSVDGISGATYSSNGMKHAVNTALEIYNENKEAILSGGK